MPLRFNKAERDEWLIHTAGDSHTCEECHDPECFGTCAPSKKKDKDGASVLDALESKTAAGVDQFGQPMQACPKCGGQGCLECHGTGRQQNVGVQPPAPEGMRTEWAPEQVRAVAKTADVLAEPAVNNPDMHLRPTHQPRTVPCQHCGAPLAAFVAEHGLACPHCGNVGGTGVIEHAAFRQADYASYPPDAQVPQTQTAQPYNPAAYEQALGDMHPAAKYAYERAVQQGINPQQALGDAQQKQQEMIQRSTEGQDINNVQIPVIGRTAKRVCRHCGMDADDQQHQGARADDVNKNPVQEILDSYDRGFVPQVVVTKAAKLLK